MLADASEHSLPSSPGSATGAVVRHLAFQTTGASGNTAMRSGVQTYSGGEDSQVTAYITSRPAQAAPRVRQPYISKVRPGYTETNSMGLSQGFLFPKSLASGEGVG